MLLNLQYFQNKRDVLDSKMGIMISDKVVNYSYQYAQTKQQVG